jgi:autonomous glycyl radical cofactor GrcA
MEFAKPVWYVGDAEKKSLAFVTSTAENGEAKMVSISNEGVVELEGVAHRAPADYGPEGGGHTYHLQSEA